jgi:hypothetical protein
MCSSAGPDARCALTAQESFGDLTNPGAEGGLSRRRKHERAHDEGAVLGDDGDVHVGPLRHIAVGIEEDALS